MTSMAISAFKARALDTIGRVSRSKERVVITKRGKPVALVVPYQTSGKAVPGKLSSALVFEKDIATPLEAGLWEASR